MVGHQGLEAVSQGVFLEESRGLMDLIAAGVEFDGVVPDKVDVLQDCCLGLVHPTVHILLDRAQIHRSCDHLQKEIGKNGISSPDRWRFNFYDYVV